MVDVGVYACSFQESQIETTAEDNVREDCNTDMQAAIDYLGPVNFAVFYNAEYFDAKKFGAAPITRRSKVNYTKIDEKTPNYFKGLMIKNLISDETSVLQLGQQEEHEFREI